MSEHDQQLSHGIVEAALKIPAAVAAHHHGAGGPEFGSPDYH